MLKDEVDSLDTPDADDLVALNYFCIVRGRALRAIIETEQSPTEEQLRLLEYLNTACITL